MMVEKYICPHCHQPVELPSSHLCETEAKEKTCGEGEYQVKFGGLSEEYLDRGFGC